MVRGAWAGDADELTGKNALIYGSSKGWQVEDGDDTACLEYSLQAQHLFLTTASSVLQDREAWAVCAVFPSLRWLWQGAEYTVKWFLARMTVGSWW